MRMPLTTNEKGSRTEGAVLSALLHSGYNVLLPFGVARYDLVIETGGEFKRVQCKTGRVRRGTALEFNVCSSPPGAPRRNYDGEVEFFAVYAPELNEVYLIPAEDVAGLKREASLRLGPTKSGQAKGTREARQYLLDPRAGSSVDRAPGS